MSVDDSQLDLQLGLKLGDSEADRSSITPERPQRMPEWTPGVRLDSPSSDGPTPPEFVGTPFHATEAPGTPKFPELYRNPYEREHLTPHIERAKKIPKQVKLGSEHFTKENKNQEMWSLITRGNFDTVTMPIEEGRKLWRMVNEGSGSAKGTQAVPPRSSGRVRCLSPAGAAPRRVSPTPRVRTPQSKPAGLNLGVTPRRPPGLGANAYPLRDGFRSVPVPPPQAFVPTHPVVRQTSPVRLTSAAGAVVQQFSPTRAMSPRPATVRVHSPIERHLVSRAPSPVRMCSDMLPPALAPCTDLLPPALASSRSGMLSPTYPTALRPPAPAAPAQPMWLGRAGWIGAHRSK